MSEYINKELSIEDLDKVTGGGTLEEVRSWLIGRQDIIKEIKRLIDSEGKQAACYYLADIIAANPQFGEDYAGLAPKLVSMVLCW